MDVLDERFLFHDSTTEGLRQGLLLACLHHVSHQPLSALLATMTGFAGVGSGPSLNRVEDLPEGLLNTAAEAFGLAKACATDIERFLKEGLCWLSGWKMALEWIHAAATQTNMLTRSSGYQQRQLYRAATSPGCLSAGAEIAQGIERLCGHRGLLGMSVEETEQLLSQFLRLSEEAGTHCLGAKEVAGRVKGMIAARQNTRPGQHSGLRSAARKTQRQRQVGKSVLVHLLTYVQMGCRLQNHQGLQQPLELEFEQPTQMALHCQHNIQFAGARIPIRKSTLLHCRVGLVGRRVGANPDSCWML